MPAFRQFPAHLILGAAKGKDQSIAQRLCLSQRLGSRIPDLESSLHFLVVHVHQLHTLQCHEASQLLDHWKPCATCFCPEDSGTTGHSLSPGPQLSFQMSYKSQFQNTEGNLRLRKINNHIKTMESLAHCRREEGNGVM